MPTTTDVIQQVAEAKCPNRTEIAGGWACTWLADNTSDIECPVCQGTGLRWPALSRECEGPVTGRWNDDCIYTEGTHSFGEDELEGFPCPCSGSGRVPDVTLEKVQLINPDIAFLVYCEVGVWYCEIGIVRPGASGPASGKGTTPELAACAALLATVED